MPNFDHHSQNLCGLFGQVFGKQAKRAPCKLALIALLSLGWGGGAHSQTQDVETGSERSIKLYQGEPEILLALQKADLLRTSTPAELIVVGDPSIADATLVADTILLLTAKSVGSTNLFVLNDDGQMILETVITVEEEGLHRINIRRAGELTTYLCGKGTGCIPTSTMVTPNETPAQDRENAR